MSHYSHTTPSQGAISVVNECGDEGDRMKSYNINASA